ncbi:alpha/beta fold hydrolase [Staphylococcus auricularis]|nr:alpha/beta hydrolase [Staphylococcus auricularis]MCE5038518.1 alpha/beta hydrolase [Staphylococcus auricularis]MEB6570240.1 alpha/beta hydrolase [Staphylococcus auricularis]
MAMELFKTQDGTVLNYQTIGEGDAIVMIHTALENYTVFHEIAPVFAESYQVVLIDLRGHGYSDRPHNISFKDYASDIKELLDHLYIDRCALLGHEMGASIAVEFAATYPDIVDALTLVNPTTLEDMSTSERLYRKYAYKIRNWAIDDQLKFLNKMLYYSKRKAKKFLKHVEETNTIATRAELLAVRNSFNNNHITTYLDKVVAPTLIIVGEHGERTTVLEAKELNDYMTHAETKFDVFNESGLYPFAEEKDHFNKVVGDFFRETYQTAEKASQH